MDMLENFIIKHSIFVRKSDQVLNTSIVRKPYYKLFKGSNFEKSIIKRSNLKILRLMRLASAEAVEYLH